MKILLVSATWMEVNLLADELELVNENGNLLKRYRIEDKEIDILVTGIGTTFATFHLTNALHLNKYDLVISIGLAGSLTSELKIGEVVSVVSEEFSDLGVENRENFLTLFESGFVNENEFPFQGGLLKASNSGGLFNLKKVRGITANKSHGKSASIKELNEKFIAHVETMEGAAVFYVCNWFGIPCFQIRAISNFIEPRGPLHWDIPLALENLRNSLLKVLKNVAVPVN